MLRFALTYYVLCNKNVCIMIGLFRTDRKSIDSGNFPLTHDCVLKVEYISDCGLRFSYFTCRSQDSGTLSVLFCSLPVVSKVNISSVDDLSNIF